MCPLKFRVFTWNLFPHSLKCIKQILLTSITSSSIKSRTFAFPQMTWCHSGHRRVHANKYIFRSISLSLSDFEVSRTIDSKYSVSRTKVCEMRLWFHAFLKNFCFLPKVILNCKLWKFFQKLQLCIRKSDDQTRSIILWMNN